MTFSPKVWGDALHLLRNEIPDFAFDAWIAPLSIRVIGHRVLVGCPTLFHRDRVRSHYADAIARCFRTAQAVAGEVSGKATTFELLTTKGFDAEEGIEFELRNVEMPLATPSSSTTPQANQLAEASRAAIGQQSALANPSTMRTVAAEDVTSQFDSCSDAIHSASIEMGFVSAAHTHSPSDTPLPAQCPAHVTSSIDASLSAAAAVSTATDVQDDALSARVLHSVAAQPTRGRLAGKRSANVRDDSRARPRARYSASRDASNPANGELQPQLPFSFESFVVGPCNALAREAALALARRRQNSLNQVYLGGESGMGKTHLARATAAEARRHGLALQNPSPSARRELNSKVVYTTAEQFTSEFVSAMRQGRPEEWKRRYRGQIGLLIVEDVQFFTGRAKTQLELFHTVEHVLDAGGNVLLTGDCAPRDLVGLDDRVRAQVGRGFVAELEMPDALVRRHILRAKAAGGGVHLPADCLDLLVESTAGSVRDIESMLIQVVTTSSLLNRTIDLELIGEAISLKSGVGTKLAARTIETSEIVRIVAAFFGKRPEILASRGRRRDILIPRQLAMYLSHRYTNASFGEIGRALGRDHPSVRNAINKIERLVLENAPIRYQIEALSERIDQMIKNQNRKSPVEPTI